LSTSTHDLLKFIEENTTSSLVKRILR